jgi:hypothetical protein
VARARLLGPGARSGVMAAGSGTTRTNRKVMSEMPTSELAGPAE